MLDLQPIKARRENAGLEYGTFIAAAPDDISALVTEVERLRAENGKLIVEIENLRSAIFRACEQLSEAADA